MSRLATHPSPYLRAAASQPVDWFSWGPEAFARARESDRPVLLDIGAVWCHWCHVMDHESYEDPAIAEVLNRDWVCIKVDRDERPDVDARYQRAVQAMTGQGGWPLTAFLTPDGDVFFGGTYFPPDGKYGQPGFRTLLIQLANAFRERRDDLMAQAAVVSRHLEQAASAPHAGAPAARILDEAAHGMGRLFDPRHGGFGSEPKFPHPSALEFLLARWHDTGDAWLGDIVHRTLVGMARGGVRDHVGGGFHRYAVDATWTVPHFEKMAYDNAGLLAAYVHAMAAGSPRHRDADPTLYRAVTEGIVAWVHGAMADPDGGYFASQDADVGPDDDGDYFTWTVQEARAVMPEDVFDVLARCYDIGERGEMRHDPHRNVLWLRETPDEAAAALGRDPAEVRALHERGLALLRDARAARAAPFVDRTIYTGWSGMLASALLTAGLSLDRADVEAHALATLERIFGEAAEPGLERGVRHALGSTVDGMLEDQVLVARAALDAYEATGAPHWLDRAGALMRHVWREYRTETGGLRDTARFVPREGFLSHELVPLQDAPTPSPNGVAAIVLARLSALTGERGWASNRDELLAAVSGGAAELSIYGATLLQAIDWAVGPATQVVVVAKRDGDAERLARAARRVYRPRKVVRWLAPGDSGSGLPDALRAMLDGSAPRAYVCAGTRCTAPVADAETLEATLATFAVGG